METCLRKGRTQSALLRDLRLKTQSIKEALEFLCNKGLIKASTDTDLELRLYETTPKGEAALTTYYTLLTQYFGGIKHLKKSTD